MHGNAASLQYHAFHASFGTLRKVLHAGMRRIGGRRGSDALNASTRRGSLKVRVTASCVAPLAALAFVFSAVRTSPKRSTDTSPSGSIHALLRCCL
jgi:hypothetical protein